MFMELDVMKRRTKFPSPLVVRALVVVVLARLAQPRHRERELLPSLRRAVPAGMVVSVGAPAVHAPIFRRVGIP